MKLRLLTTSLCLALAGLSISQLFSRELPIQHNEQRFYYLPQMTEEEMLHFIENSGSILVCPEGSVIPFALFLNGEFFESETNTSDPKYSLRIKKTIYLCIINDQFLMSVDGSHWKTREEMFAGMISVGLKSEENHPKITLGMELNQRSE